MHTDDMNDFVLMGLARDMAVAEARQLQERVAELEAALEEVDGRLTNLQPVIANGLLNELQLSVIDNSINPCISIIRAALKGKDT